MSSIDDPKRVLFPRNARHGQSAAAAFSLLAVLMLSACASSTSEAATATHPTPLSLDFVWPRSSAPTIPYLQQNPTPPDAVIAHWNPDAYTHRDIDEIAGQQCMTFSEAAKPVTPPSQRGGEATQRFDCVAMRGGSRVG